MKKIGIYGSIDVGDVKDKTIDYIAVDNGINHLLKYHIEPILVMGDLDSLTNKEIINKYSMKIYSPIKDDTDTALAVSKAISDGYSAIDIYGVTHKRLDHFIAVICLLKKYPDISITIYDEYNKIYLLPKGIHHIPKETYKYFSLFAFEPTVITLKNCHYPLDHYLLNIDDPLCVSNQTDDIVEVINDHHLLFIQSN